MTPKKNLCSNSAPNWQLWHFAARPWQLLGQAARREQWSICHCPEYCWISLGKQKKGAVCQPSRKAKKSHWDGFPHLAHPWRYRLPSENNTCTMWNIQGGKIKTMKLRKTVMHRTKQVPWEHLYSFQRNSGNSKTSQETISICKYY